MATPSLFIGSSVAALDVANAVQANLNVPGAFEAVVWNQGVFMPGEMLIGSLLRASKQFQFAALILTADDLVRSKGIDRAAPRDNVILEIGFFVAALGLKRTFLICEAGADLKLPRDLDGIVHVKFTRPANPEFLQSAVSHACEMIKKAAARVPMDEIGESALTPKDELITGLIKNALSLVCKALGAPMLAHEARLRAFIFQKVTDPEDGPQLVCTHFWSPFQVVEHVGLTFDINEANQDRIAVVRAWKARKVCSVEVQPGADREVDPELCHVLAAPIMGTNGREAWGTVDVDACSPKGALLLKDESSQNVVFLLGRLLYTVFSIRGDAPSERAAA